jgi:hypothetical protein
MELLTWIPFAIVVALISWSLAYSAHHQEQHQHGRHYSRADRRKYHHP